MTPADLATRIRQSAAGCDRFIAALAGPPGAGKSTLAADLAARLGPDAAAVPMDGFHYDDNVLIQRGQRDRKGAPYTFDAQGFLHLLARLRTEAEVAIPIFDRSLELSRASAAIIGPDQRILIVEGNYLLLNDDPWPRARPFFDLTVMIDVPLATLEDRLMDRWLGFGKSPVAARAWIASNDMPNIRAVLDRSAPADVTLRTG